MKTNKKKREIHPLNNPHYRALSASILIIGMSLAVWPLVAARTQSRVLLPSAIISPSPTFSPTSTILDWRLYTNRVAGYTIKVPPQWRVVVNEDKSILLHQDVVGSISMNANFPGKELTPGDPNSASMDIDFPISIHGPHQDVGIIYEHGLKGLEKSSNWGANAIKYARYTEIDGREALIVKAVSASMPPPQFGGEWSDEYSTKSVYIDLGNGQILTIEGDWGKMRKDFEDLFDKVVSTVHFTSL